VWTDQTFVLAANASIPQILVECWDWNILGNHGFMGEFFVSVAEIPEDGSPVRKHWDLELAQDKKNKTKKTSHVSGTIELEIFKAT